jgi:hypothetical protein
MIVPTNFPSLNFYKLKLKAMSKIPKPENKIKLKKLSLEIFHKVPNNKNKPQIKTKIAQSKTSNPKTTSSHLTHPTTSVNSAILVPPPTNPSLAAQLPNKNIPKTNTPVSPISKN